MANDDPILRYYEAEMRYLRESGKEFAKAHPDRARLLNLDRVGDRDPYVERLFEGFAFLTGRLRQKLDDELPELTEGLVSLLWPHYLRMIPSLSIVELIPLSEKLQKTEVVPAGVSIRSAPIAVPPPAGAEGLSPKTVQCIYRTTQAVTLQPLTVTHAGPTVRHDGRSAIRLGFSLGGSARPMETDLSRLRLYLNADLPTAFAMHLALTRQIDTIQLRIPEIRDGEAMPLAGVAIEPAGFSAEERLWPKADAAFSGYQLLLEYFTFREKFLFVDLCGLDVTKLPERTTRFELEIVLTQAYPSDQRFSAENVRLFCSPVINLFELDAEPIEIDHHETEYRVVPAGHQGEHVETYSVDAIEAFDHETAERYEYVPFATFRHRGGMLRHEAPERYFHSRVRSGVAGLHETWVVLGGHAWETMEALPEESLSLRVTGTNGLLPRKGLREASLDELATSSQNVTGVRNLVSPTLPLYPPTEDRFQWRVLSHLAPNFLSMMNAEVLRGALALYDWTDDELNRRRLAGILWVSQALIEEVSGGAVERGALIEVTLDSHAFAGDGDVMLFGELLHRFFALYADINLFTKLAIVQPAVAGSDRMATQQGRAGAVMKLHDFPDLDLLVASLLTRAPRMNFMQLCRLLEAHFPDRPGFGTRDALEHEPVRFRPRPRMGFPASEVASVEFDDGSDTFGQGSPPTVRTTFMGLYGVDAAMPSHLIDEIVLREEGHEAVEAFLDQFNHRYVTLLYRAWRKYRYPEHFRPGGIDAHSRNLLCLAGFGWGDKPKRAGLPDSRMLALLGLLIQRTRTPEGLAGVVALAIPRVEVRVDEFWPVVTSTGRPRPLTGAGPAVGKSRASQRKGLGGGYVLGKRMAYRSRAVRVTLRPADARQAQDLLPGAGLHRDLMAFVQLYVGVKADVHLRMEVSSRYTPEPAIGQGNAGPVPRLGWTTVLPADEERIVNIALGVYEAFPATAPNPYLTASHA